MKILKISDKNDLTILLNNSNLPTSDIKFEKNKYFYGIHNRNQLIAAIGLELFNSSALLRSLVVDKNERKKGLGVKLVKFIEDKCRIKKVTDLYLLTTTAEKFFLKYGYKKIERSEGPEDIKNTTQFSDLCPSSSSFMMKKL